MLWSQEAFLSLRAARFLWRSRDRPAVLQCEIRWKKKTCCFNLLLDKIGFTLNIGKEINPFFEILNKIYGWLFLALPYQWSKCAEEVASMLLEDPMQADGQRMIQTGELFSTVNTSPASLLRPSLAMESISAIGPSMNQSVRSPSGLRWCMDLSKKHGV